MPLEVTLLSSDAIRQESAALGVDLAPHQADQLDRFARLLAKWNRVHNLTARDKPAEILSHHLLDSLSIVPELARIADGRGLRILDVGAGGGLPSVPLAIALNDARLTAIDRVQKKTAFIQQARGELQLANLDVVHGRVEDYSAPSFDVIVARAFSTLAELVRLTAHLLRADGYWVAMKGAYPTEEINALPSAVEIVRAVKLRVPLLDAERHLVVLRSR